MNLFRIYIAFYVYLRIDYCDEQTVYLNNDISDTIGDTYMFDISGESSDFSTSSGVR